MKRTAISLGLAGIVLLAACEKKEVILTGERENIDAVLSEGNVETTLASNQAPAAAPPLSLPATRANTDWTQSIASPATRTAHPALGPTPRLAWSVDIGAGDGKRNRINADPVVAGGRIFTLDSEARVSAVSTSGQLLWTRDLTPPNDSGSDASGGGLAYGAGKVFVSSGFGLMTALDAATGAEVWQQDLRTTGTGSPTVYDGLVYLVSGDEIGWALDANNGRIKWQLSGTADRNNVLGAPAPAISSKYAVFAFGSGQVQGAFRKGGLRRWDAQVAGRRLGFGTGSVTDITTDPVIEGNTVYVGSHAGRTVALDIGNGERLWTAPDGPLNPVWPAGDSIFMVSDRNELLRLSARDGSRLWARKLPFFTNAKPRRQNEIYAHHGPIIAGGRLIIASNDGLMRFFNPQNGQSLGSVELPGGATTEPVVAGRTLYVVSTQGQLLAFR
ncbi:MAG: PQQ-binding-like beta-propeller repeat protein [Roseovarius sp.]|uniref:PQQ-like beta-propeller repeat protein n=1 Tax=Roseovarius sp. TaxID=1486281 RepID=UPI0032EB529C